MLTAVQAFFGVPQTDNGEKKLSDEYTGWEDKQTKALPEESIDLTKMSAADIDGEFYRAEVRFDNDVVKQPQKVVDQLIKAVEKFPPWYVVGTHQCPHDTDDGGSCSPDAVYTGGGAPQPILAAVSPEQ